MGMERNLKTWFNRGTPWVWLNAGAVSISIIMVVGLLLLIAVRGLGHFWPAPLLEADYLGRDGQQVRVVGVIQDTEQVSAKRLRSLGETVVTDAEMVDRHLVKVGNRDISGVDFLWLIDVNLRNRHYPAGLMIIERREWGDMYGYLHQVRQQGQVVAEGEQAWPVLQQQLTRTLELYDQIRAIEKHEIGAINYAMERLRLKQRGLELKGKLDDQHQAAIDARQAELQQQYQQYQQQLLGLYRTYQQDSISVKLADGQIVELAMAMIVKAYRPNMMSWLDKVGFYIAKLWEFVSEEPREANTEGGIFPAIFGTVMMVILMTIFVTPFGVIAAIYLREYASQGWLTRMIRIAVNNLAGVPSIVYGVFGLGFFVYVLGGNIDQLFFPEALPAPTFGTPGILWAALTLSLMTVPVVIVATEEGLSRIPSSIREGSLALGATKAETLWRTILPMASPAMMTGLILAIARAAGEVAPLMLVGVVKLAPSLPLDENFPFLHLDRKFMHLGFHIFDLGFQSPNVEAARPLVYATALLLVVVIVLLNLVAIAVRNRLREKYRALEH
jgi:phosphate transport system permease protein